MPPPTLNESTAPGVKPGAAQERPRKDEDRQDDQYHRITLVDKWRLLQLIVADAELSATARIVAAYLLDCFNLERDPDKACFPKIDTIAEAVGRGRTAIKGAIAELVKRRWLSKRRHGRTYYVFAFDRLPSRDGPRPDHTKSESQAERSENRPFDGPKADHSKGLKADHSKSQGTDTGNRYRVGGDHSEENDLFGRNAHRSESSRRRKPNRRSHLSEAWRPVVKDIAAALEIGVSDEAIPREAEKFKNHHIGKGTLMLDWHRAWRNWCIKAVEFAQERNAKANGKSRSFADGVMAAGVRRGWQL